MTRLSRLRNDERGVAAIEFALIAPIVVLLLIGASTFFAAYRTDTRAKTATYTIGDLISRQSSVDDAFLNNLKQMFVHLAPESPTAPGIRVTSVTKLGKVYLVDWSYASAPFAKMTAIGALAMSLPDSETGESLLIVESSVAHRPVFVGAGMTITTFKNLTTLRPRYVSRVSKS